MSLTLRRTRLAFELLEDRAAPALLGNQLFPDDHPWNQQITSAPVAANSTAIINNIINLYGNNRLHPDFGQDYDNGNDLYGIPVNVVHGNSVPKVQIVIDAYPDESDLLNVPIPPSAVLEGDYQNGPKFGVNNRGDSHLIIYDVDNNVAYELYRASRPSENADGKWHADQETVWDMKTNNFRTLGWTSADAAGLSILAGLVRPDEALPVNQGGQGVIDHAIRMTLRNNIILDQFIYPASHTANPGNNNLAVMPPMGARFRLKSTVDISTLNPQSRVIAQAMKDYGMIVADNGSNFFFTGASYSVNASNQQVLTWDDDDIQDTTFGLKSLRFSDFEVVDLTPSVTSLSTQTGAAGTQVTLNGKNFSGAAGHLQVYFGNTLSTNVTFVDDSHIIAVAPAGSGQVDVRVQSGVTTSSNSDNYKNPVFGYGTSPNTAADDFIYGGGGGGGGNQNQPPKVATAAKATPSPVTGKTTTLTVLGSDDGGEANLIYTWSILSKPTGAADPTFSVNGSNAAKSSVATFAKAGTYTFRATIADAQGLTVISDVSVVVQQKLTKITVTPGSATLAIKAKLQFAASAFDQFDNPMSTQPTFSWKVTGKGSMNRYGLYTAPGKIGGPYTITAQSGLVKGTATVTVI